ncbi:MAG TPA: DnaA/Hda family protein, partial [Alphaproteobacteria bacterium]|nr:DnaA/Hda family protein [Alphaproteobacteria bacterium]
MSQMAFQFDPAPSYTATNFLVSDNNRAAYDAIYAWPNWPAPVVILVGAVGVGKTHLLELWRQRSEAMTCD